MKYIEVSFSLPENFREILIAELYEAKYDSFAETTEGIQAYIPSESFKEEDLLLLLKKYKEYFQATYSYSYLEDKNWNEEWEKNFEPVIINHDCIIRASFHVPDKEYKYDIIINPKMSFGTGHHETTSMMVSHLINLKTLQGQKIMDAGCGTGILSIVASKLGASFVTSFDIEEWAYENAVENNKQNHINNVYVSIGTISSVIHPGDLYDVIVANINKNVLLEEIPHYSQHLRNRGKILLSGFYKQDIEDIDEVAIKYCLKKSDNIIKNNWASLVYEKYAP